MSVSGVYANDCKACEATRNAAQLENRCSEGQSAQIRMAHCLVKSRLNTALYKSSIGGVGMSTVLAKLCSPPSNSNCPISLHFIFLQALLPLSTAKTPTFIQHLTYKVARTLCSRPKGLMGSVALGRSGALNSSGERTLHCQPMDFKG